MGKLVVTLFKGIAIAARANRAKVVTQYTQYVLSPWAIKFQDCHLQLHMQVKLPWLCHVVMSCVKHALFAIGSVCGFLESKRGPPGITRHAALKWSSELRVANT